jgi:hypothetical protein
MIDGLSTVKLIHKNTLAARQPAKQDTVVRKHAKTGLGTV